MFIFLFTFTQIIILADFAFKLNSPHRLNLTVIAHLIFMQDIFTDIVLNKKEIPFIQFLFFKAIVADIKILLFLAFISMFAFFNSLSANITFHWIFPFLVILTKLITDADNQKKNRIKQKFIKGWKLKVNLPEPSWT